jgi:hypothetical protein
MLSPAAGIGGLRLASDDAVLDLGADVVELWIGLLMAVDINLKRRYAQRKCLISQQVNIIVLIRQ